MGELGLLGMTLPSAKGGGGQTCRTYCDAVREIAKGDPALAMNVAAVNALCVGHFDRFASDEQCQKYLPGIVRGEVKMAWGLSEPDAGSDAKRVRTRGTPIEDRPGFFRLNGRKMFITNAGKADLMVIMARISDTELTAFLVETAQPGFRNVERIPHGRRLRLVDDGVRFGRCRGVAYAVPV